MGRMVVNGQRACPMDVRISFGNVSCRSVSARLGFGMPGRAMAQHIIHSTVIPITKVPTSASKVGRQEAALQTLLKTGCTGATVLQQAMRTNIVPCALLLARGER